MRRTLPLSALAALLLLPAMASAQTTPVGAVFAMTNAAAGNEVLAFDRDAQGALTLANTFPTNGMGTGLALDSHGSLVISKDGLHLVAANAGSDEITLFGVSGATLTVQDKVSSGGNKPVSLALREDTLYVLNGGNPNEITGFTITAQDTLVPIPNSTRALSAAATKPAQIAFSPSGQILAVTEATTDLVDWFTLDPSTDVSLTFQSMPASSPTPFGVLFRGANHIYVAQAEDGLVDMGSVSSYGIRQSSLVPENTVDSTESGTSGIVMTPSKRYVYASNVESGTITGYDVGPQGALSLLDPTGVSATAGAAPLDLAITRNSSFLYALNTGDGTISGWHVDAPTGALTAVQTPPVGGLPTAGAAGLVAR
jgi:6-phosphogluconolactonase